MSLSRTDLLAASSDAIKRLQTAEVKADEFREGATIRVRELSAKERWLWSKTSQKATDDDSVPDPATYLVTMAAIDNDGAKLLQQADADWLQQQSGALISRLADKIMVMSGLATEDESGNESSSNSTPTESEPSPSDSSSEASEGEPSPS